MGLGRAVAAGAANAMGLGGAAAAQEGAVAEPNEANC